MHGSVMPAVSLPGAHAQDAEGEYMKSFRSIRDKGQLRAICAALNKLIWKTYTRHGATGESVHDDAEYWVGELLDRDIDIRWNRSEYRFELRRERR